MRYFSANTRSTVDAVVRQQVPNQLFPLGLRHAVLDVAEQQAAGAIAWHRHERQVVVDQVDLVLVAKQVADDLVLDHRVGIQEQHPTPPLPFVGHGHRV